MIDKRVLDEQGYVVARGLFSAGEAAFLLDHFMRLREAGEYPGDVVGVDPTSNDPLKRYPRMIHMHRWDEIALAWLLEPRLAHALTMLLSGREPFAVQTMLYFKPPARAGRPSFKPPARAGRPSTRTSTTSRQPRYVHRRLDGARAVRRGERLPRGAAGQPTLAGPLHDRRGHGAELHRRHGALPDDAELVPVMMEPGDVLFFNGSLVHGSGPNRSGNRFRRSLVGHYIVGDARECALSYHPALRLDGTTVELELGEGGGPCGEWVDGEIVLTE